jgi:ribosomal protein S7
MHQESVKTKKCQIKYLMKYMMHIKIEDRPLKKKEDTHKMAESNKAFAHFRW